MMGGGSVRPGPVTLAPVTWDCDERIRGNDLIYNLPKLRQTIKIINLFYKYRKSSLFHLFSLSIYFIDLESHKFEKRIVLLLGLWNTISRIVSFDYSVLSALRQGPSESNFEKAGGRLPGDGCVKWQFANVCKLSVTEGGVRGARPEVGGGRCRQYPGLAASAQIPGTGQQLVAGPGGVSVWIMAQPAPSHQLSCVTQY